MGTSVFKKMRRAYELGPRWTYALAGLKLRTRMGMLPKVPPTIYVELTNACNLYCTMCDRYSMTRNEGRMEIGLLKKIIDNAAEIRVPAVKLNRFGESFLHPELVPMIRYSKEKGIPWVYFTSNGTLLTEENTIEVLRSGLDSITFSVDGATASTYEKIRKDARYNVIVDNIRRFYEMRKKLGLKKPRIVLNTLLMKETSDEIMDFFKIWNPIADHINVMPVGRYGNVEDLGTVDRGKLENAKRPCHHPFDRLLVFWNGDVTICCGDINGVLHIGCVLGDRIETLWNNEKITRFRKNHLSKDYTDNSLCNACDGTNRILFEEMQKAREHIYRRAGGSVR